MQKTDVISCIRYSPVALKKDDRSRMKQKLEEAIDAFGGEEQLCFSCVGIDASVPMSKIKDYLDVFGGEDHEQK